MSYKPLVAQRGNNLLWAEKKIRNGMMEATEKLEWCDITVKIEGGNVVHFQKLVKEKPPK